MEIRKLLGCLPLVVALFAFTACSDDDSDDGGESVAWAGIAGTYTGYTSTTFAYTTFPMVYENETLVISVNQDGTVDMRLDSQDWDTVVTGANVVEGGSDYSIQGSATASLAGHDGTVSDYEGTVSATVSKDRGTVSCTISLPGVMGGTTISFRNGEAPASSLVAGVYTGTMSMSFAYGDLDYEDESVTISPNGDDAVDISYSSEDVGVAEITGVPVTRSGDTVTIVETEDVFSMPLHSGGMSDYPCLVSGTIKTDQSDFSIVFILPGVMGGTTLTLVPAE